MNKCTANEASLVAQRLKRLPPMRKTRVWSLGREDLLEKEMAIHSSILAWRIPWIEEPGGLQSAGLQRVGHDWAASLFMYKMLIEIFYRKESSVISRTLVPDPILPTERMIFYKVGFDSPRFLIDSHPLHPCIHLCIHPPIWQKFSA